jgi:hypothetical protein
MIQFLRQTSVKHADDSTLKTIFIAICDIVAHYRASKGTLMGFINRWIEGMQRPSKYLLEGVDPYAIIKKLQDAHLLSFVPNNEAFTKSGFENLLDATFNFNSSAGLGYMNRPKSDTEVLRVAESIARELHGELASVSNVVTWLQDALTSPRKRAKLTVALAAKLETYELADLEKKVRPYYIYPFHLVILFAPIIQAMKKQWDLFDVAGSNAIGFSYVANKKFPLGGATFLMRKVQTLKPSECLLISYADDQFWAFNVNGTIILRCEDIKQMDSNVTKPIGVLLYSLFMRMFPKAHLVWQNVAKLLTLMQFSHPLVIQSAMTVFKQDKLSTGVAGTSEADQMLSMLIQLFLKVGFQKWAKSETETKPDAIISNFEKFLSEAKYEITKESAIEFKPEGDISYKILPNYTKPQFLRATFLGFNLLCVGSDKDGNVWVPAKDLKNTLKMMIIPHTQSKLPGPDLFVARAVGCSISGMYLYPSLYNTVSDQAKTMMSNLMIDKDGNQIQVNPQKAFSVVIIEDAVSADLQALWKKWGETLPPASDILSLYVDPTKFKSLKFFKTFEYLLSNQIVDPSFNLEDQPELPVKTIGNKNSWFDQLDLDDDFKPHPQERSKGKEESEETRPVFSDDEYLSPLDQSDHEESLEIEQVQEEKRLEKTMSPLVITTKPTKTEPAKAVTIETMESVNKIDEKPELKNVKTQEKRKGSKYVQKQRQKLQDDFEFKPQQTSAVQMHRTKAQLEEDPIPIIKDPKKIGIGETDQRNQARKMALINDKIAKLRDLRNRVRLGQQELNELIRTTPMKRALRGQVRQARHKEEDNIHNNTKESYYDESFEQAQQYEEQFDNDNNNNKDDFGKDYEEQRESRSKSSKNTQKGKQSRRSPSPRDDPSIFQL